MELELRSSSSAYSVWIVATDGVKLEPSSCWQSSSKCPYTGHGGVDVSVCSMRCVHCAPLSCKSVGTKNCVTGFQASTGSVYENLVSFNS